MSVVRKEPKTARKTDDLKSKQDMLFLNSILSKARDCTGFSFYLWWFPNQIQRVLEHLFKNKPAEQDLNGLLSLIVFAGIDCEEDVYFKEEIIDKFFLSKFPNQNCFFGSQQNLSDLLFGITIDDVSTLAFMNATFSVLTILYISRVLGCLKVFENAAQTERAYQILF